MEPTAGFNLTRTGLSIHGTGFVRPQTADQFPNGGRCLNLQRLEKATRLCFRKLTQAGLRRHVGFEQGLPHASLIGRWPLDVIDDEDWNRRFCGFEPQAKLL